MTYRPSAGLQVGKPGCPHRNVRSRGPPRTREAAFQVGRGSTWGLHPISGPSSGPSSGEDASLRPSRAAVYSRRSAQRGHVLECARSGKNRHAAGSEARAKSSTRTRH